MLTMNESTRKHPAHTMTHPTPYRRAHPFCTWTVIAFFIVLSGIALAGTALAEEDWRDQLGKMAAPPTTVPVGVCAAPPKKLPPAMAPSFRWLQPLPQGDNLLGVWGSGPKNVWAAGDAGRIVHFDGNKWDLVHTGIADYLAGVWGSSRKDVWITGYNGRVLRFDGKKWWDHPTGVSNDFNGIWGSGPKDVFTVGDRGVIFHWDGSCFKRQESGTENLFFGVWGTGPQDVWAVGGRGNIAHYDGKTWSQVDTGFPGQKLGHFVSVWGTGKEDVYVAGILPDTRAKNADVYHNLLHYDGSRWQTVDTQINGLLRWIWGTGPDDIWITGDEGVMTHFDGNSWTALPILDRLTRRGGWSDPGGRSVWVVGDDGLIAPPQMWSYPGGKPAWAVGDDGPIAKARFLPSMAPPPPNPDGLPSPTPLPTGETLSALSASGVGVGRGGGIFRWDGAGWKTIKTGGFSLFSVADDPTTPNTAWAVGDFGRIVRIEGETATELSGVTGQPLWKVEVHPYGSVTVRGDAGVILERPAGKK